MSESFDFQPPRAFGLAIRIVCYGIAVFWAGAALYNLHHPSDSPTWLLVIFALGAGGVPFLADWVDARERRRLEQLEQELLQLLAAMARDIHRRRWETELRATSWREVLGVGPDAPRAEVRQAFNHLVKRYHADTAKSGADRGKLAEVMNAWGAAKRYFDEQKRA